MVDDDERGNVEVFVEEIWTNFFGREALVTFFLSFFLFLLFFLGLQCKAYIIDVTFYIIVLLYNEFMLCLIGIIDQES